MADPELMPQPTLRVATPKPKMTIYFVLLIIALVAMLTACIFMYLVIRTFGGFGAVQGRVAALPQQHESTRHRVHRLHAADSQAYPVASVGSVVAS